MLHINAVRLGGVFLVAVSCCSYAQEQIKVGIVAPFSGPFAEYGKQMEGGIKTYQKMHGDSVVGKKVVFLTRDSTGPVPELAKRLSQELVVRDKVDFLGDYGFTPGALAALPVAQLAKIPMIIMNAVGVTIMQKSQYAVRSSNTLVQVSAPMGRWAASQGIKKVVTLVADYTPGRDAEQAFIKSFQAAGGEVIDSIRVPLQSKDLAPFIQHIKDLNPQGVFMWLPAGDMTISFAKQFRERDLAKAGIKIIATGDLTDDHLLPAKGDDAVGLVTTYHYSMAHNSPENHEFLKTFKEVNPTAGRPNFMAVAAYDGAAAIYDVVQQLDSKMDSAKAMRILGNIKMVSPRGPVHIDPRTRDIVQTVYVRRVQKVNGSLENIEFAKSDNIDDEGNAVSN